MKILGLSVDVPTCSAAALIDGGRLVCGSPEERLDRVKWSMEFPTRAIAHCLRTRRLELSDLDAVAIAWNPLINIAEMSLSRLTARHRHKAELLYGVPARLLSLVGEDPGRMTQRIALGGSGAVEIHYVTHHDCHAAHAFFESGFEEAAILTCDGYGENETVTVGIGRDGRTERIATTYFPNSLGLFYGTVTEYLGYRHDSDEWKVMALGAYGAPDPELYRKLRDLFTVGDDLTIGFDTALFQFDNALKEGLFDEALTEYLGIPPVRAGEGAFEDRHCDLARAAQSVFEDVLLALCGKIARQTGLAKLCLGGGSVMNSVFNGKLAMSGLYDDLYVPFAPNDSGAAIGAAYDVHFNLLGGPPTRPAAPATPYLGPAYSDDEIGAALELYKCRYRPVADIEAAVARLLAEGHVLGWFQGAMEFGERALGNRSILADPRDPETKARVNAAVKFREGFRPFAPAVLAEAADDYFELPGPGYETPFMEKVFAFRPGKAAQVPSVVHADGTGRLQTVSQASNPRFHALIRAFSELTGVPMVLNTSLNRNGEPIACSPEDALAIFFGSGLDYLAIGNLLVEK